MWYSALALWLGPIRGQQHVPKCLVSIVFIGTVLCWSEGMEKWNSDKEVRTVALVQSIAFWRGYLDVNLEVGMVRYEVG